MMLTIPKTVKNAVHVSFHHGTAKLNGIFLNEIP